MTKKYIRYHSDRISSIYYRGADSMYLNLNFDRRLTPIVMLKGGIAG